MSSVYFESWGRRETLKFYHRKAQTELDNMIKYRMKEGVFQDDFLGYVLYAEKISADRTHFENVMLAPGRESQKEHFTLLAPAASIDGSVEAGDLADDLHLWNDLLNAACIDRCFDHEIPKARSRSSSNLSRSDLWTGQRRG